MVGMKTTNGAYIIDSLDKILIGHPTGHDKNLWSIPKGLYDVGETSKEAAIREVWEETNIDLELFTNKTTYIELGVEQYTTKKKQLHAHLFYIDLPLSEMDLNIWCKSTFVCEKHEVELPENDKTKWETLDFAAIHLHDSQQNFLKKVGDLLVSDILK